MSIPGYIACTSPATGSTSATHEMVPSNDEASFVTKSAYSVSETYSYESYWYPPRYRTNWQYMYPSNQGVSLPEDFLPPRHNFSRPPTQPDFVPSASSILKHDDNDDFIWELRDTDILTGRGAPTKFHSGNQWFRDIISQYQTSYICSKRSDKPRIAKEVQELIRSRGGRFLKRHHRAAGRAAWVKIGEQQAYEKVCQSLRDGAPEIRRQMLSCTSKKQNKSKYQEECNKENYTPIACW